MPKTSHGPIEGPMEVKVSHRSLPSMLRYVRSRLAFENMGAEMVYQEIIAKAEKLEARLNEQQDAVERAIELLNEDAVLHELGRKTEEALAELNKVL